MNFETHVEMLEQQQVASTLVEKVAEENDEEALAEVCAELEATAREASQERDLGKHAGIACLYMVVNRLSDPDRDKVGFGQ